MYYFFHQYFFLTEEFVLDLDFIPAKKLFICFSVLTEEFVLEYDLDMPGENIVITASFEEEFLAKAMVNDLKVKFPKCDYFLLPDKSNSKEEVYKVFIGPYDTEEETNQWTKNLELDFEIIKL